MTTIPLAAAPTAQQSASDSDAPSTGRRLALLRHGKSAYPDEVADHDRPLAPRGRRQAGLAGDRLAREIGAFDVVLCSTATRTRETLAASGVLDGMVTADRVQYRPEIYGAGYEELLPLLRALPSPVRSVLVVGHFPGLPDLADELAGPGSDDEALRRLGDRFPTSAIALLETSGGWSNLGPQTTRLVDVIVER
ncbi:histidine phosphatase family protein [Nakamurella flava]|uniref:Histidine phosphatase family protein n=1 Tax=Nakamurella flava TaxID=2576308 RepID=A0A4U6Q8Y8_9ACTN|nr:histidine phosphatase family protein [Nakamurella flava]TKV56341.1 histidine phosphatase family protein [Nakamurella flava]